MSVPITEADFEAALANASPLARSRIVRRMNKTPLPKDVEMQVENFTLLYKDGPPRPGSHAELNEKRIIKQTLEVIDETNK